VRSASWLTRRARGRLDSHRQIGLFRGFVAYPFCERVSSRQPPVSRELHAGLSRSVTLRGLSHSVALRGLSRQTAAGLPLQGARRSRQKAPGLSPDGDSIAGCWAEDQASLAKSLKHSHVSPRQKTSGASPPKNRRALWRQTLTNLSTNKLLT
jgi:hypothetical protein